MALYRVSYSVWCGGAYLSSQHLGGRDMKNEDTKFKSRLV